MLTKPFLAYNRWFPVKVRVSLIFDIDLYLVILFGCFSRNVLTSLYVTIPVDDTVSKYNKLKFTEFQTIL